MSMLWLALIVPAAAVTLVYGVKTTRCICRWRRKQQKLDAINVQYERLRSARQDAVYHHGWATSRGDLKEADAHEAHVIELDRKLQVLRDQYDSVSAGNTDDKWDGSSAALVIEHKSKEDDACEFAIMRRNSVPR
eukprot:CAMPEP_0198538754 /NCGR_PEP_ID=MMETSP1462-20131121/48042_1 /TAXON_ID=1333877 /ORGANISM="Brandtodinium nutriculum, Strain RCC3387" /LENGTH=134 /DNA_ID=CAMNT_0044268787 /DNA_START=37 /DNA_END=438 /DNA_ORIENTATION=-